jgi:hypothetical protein
MLHSVALDESRCGCMDSPQAWENAETGTWVVSLSFRQIKAARYLVMQRIGPP